VHRNDPECSWRTPLGASPAVIFPAAAAVSAAATFLTAPFAVGVAVWLAVALLPWVLIAGGMRVPNVVLTIGTVVPTAFMVIGYDALGAEFLLMVLIPALVSARAHLLYPAVAAVAGSVLPFVQAMRLDGAQLEPWHKEGWVFFACGMAFTWFLGVLLRRERDLVEQLRSVQGALTEAGAAEERRRIARELHDIVGHSLTVVLLNVSGARRSLTSRPEAAAEALERAEAVGRESLDHVRAVVGLLRDPEGGPVQDAPLPKAADLADLVRDAQRAGQHVELDVRAGVRLEGLDPAVGLAVYRAVQEALANAERYAPGAGVQVTVERSDRELRLEVVNAPSSRPAPEPTTRSGLGLIGMRERLSAVHGAVDAGPTAAGGWRVVATLPWTDRYAST
jgi:signal transduction histidine kinase